MSNKSIKIGLVELTSNQAGGWWAEVENSNLRVLCKTAEHVLAAICTNAGQRIFTRTGELVFVDYTTQKGFVFYVTISSGVAVEISNVQKLLESVLAGYGQSLSNVSEDVRKIAEEFAELRSKANAETEMEVRPSSSAILAQKHTKAPIGVVEKQSPEDAAKWAAIEAAGSTCLVFAVVTELAQFKQSGILACQRCIEGMLTAIHQQDFKNAGVLRVGMDTDDCKFKEVTIVLQKAWCHVTPTTIEELVTQLKIQRDHLVAARVYRDEVESAKELERLIGSIKI